MLKGLRTGKAQGVVIHKIDRSARNLRDWSDLGELIDQGIEVHFANESLDLQTRGGRLSADIQAVVASDYIRNLREETKKGIRGRLRQGIYPFGAPVGYVNNGGGKLKTIDPVKGPLVRKAFELYATGKFNMHSLREELYQMGLRGTTDKKLTLCGVSTILNNPFYTGLIRIRKTKEIYPGNHEPLISIHLFNLVRDTLSGRFHSRTKHHEFLFRRLIRCADCGYKVIGETQRGHTYYRCQTKGCPTNSIREEAIEAVVLERLSRLQFSGGESAYLKDRIATLKARWIIDREQAITDLSTKLDLLTERLKKATDAYLDGILERDVYEERKQNLLFERKALQITIEDYKANRRSVPEVLAEFLERAGSAYLLYKSANPQKKRRMVKILTSNMSLRSKNLDFTYSAPFSEIANREKMSSCAHPWCVPRTWEPIIAGLVSFFANHPESDFSVAPEL
jgi:site-specific DNA recombinase